MVGIILAGFIISNVGVLIYHKLTDVPEPPKAEIQAVPIFLTLAFSSGVMLRFYKCWGETCARNDACWVLKPCPFCNPIRVIPNQAWLHQRQLYYPKMTASILLKSRYRSCKAWAASSSPMALYAPKQASKVTAWKPDTAGSGLMHSR